MRILPTAPSVQDPKQRATTAFVLVLISLLGIAELAQAARFASTRVFRSGGWAEYCVAADVNGDGNPDILVSGAALTVLLGKGDGTFLPPKWIADFPEGAPQFAVGDFNRDGRPDLALTSNSLVKIYRGRGDGTFSAPLAFAAGGDRSWRIVTAYVNRDSNLDLVVSSDSVISVLLGNGDATFQKPIVTMAPGGIFAVGDRNGDGYLDLVSSDIYSTKQFWYGDGNGNFKRGSDVLIPPGTGEALLADLDGDGKAEIIVGDGFGGPPQGLAISWGDGYCCTRLTAGSPASSILAKDLNGDGKPDLAVSNGSSDSVSILLNAGSKKFAGAVNYTTRRQPFTLTSADLNRDGRPDLALATEDGIQPFINRGNARFPEPLAIETAYLPNTREVWVKDAKAVELNADGHMDLALQLAGSLVSDLDSYGPLYVLLGKGNGQFSGYPAFSFYSTESYFVSGIAIADYNHDGRLDLALASEEVTSIDDGDLLIAVNLGGGHFSPLGSPLRGNPHAKMAAGRFNAGANGDLAVLNEESGNVAIFLGNGDLSFRGPTSYQVGANPNSILVRDVNKDGKYDLIITNGGSSDISLLLGNGDGTFQRARNTEVAQHPASAAVGDFDRDGKLDLVVGGETVQVLMGRGDGTFDSPVTLPVTGTALFVGQTDLRHLGKEDILVANGKALVVLYGNGDGTFLAPLSYNVGRGPISFTIGDFNEDGAPDVVGMGGMNGSSSLTLLLNQGGTLVSIKSSATSATAGQPVTFTATVVAGVPGAGEVTGTVAFKDGPKGIGFVHLSKGKATFTTSQLTPGTHTMTASYWGNGFFNPQISSPLTERIGP